MPSISKKRNMLIAEKYLSKNTEMSIESILLQLKMVALVGIHLNPVSFLMLQYHTFIHILLMKKASLLKERDNT